MKRPRVFVPERSHRYDTSDAAQFGEINYLLSEVKVFDLDRCTTSLTTAFKDAQFNPNVDTICMTGPALLIAYTLATAALLYGTVHILLYDASKSTYKRRTWSGANLNLVVTTKRECYGK